jgi:sporulation protein YabP
LQYPELAYGISKLCIHVTIFESFSEHKSKPPLLGIWFKKKRNRGLDSLEKNTGNMHRLTMDNREFLAITGVSKVQSFDPKEIVLETIQGVLSIKGEKLGIKHLDLKEGMVEVEGYVESLVYPRQSGSGSRQNLWGRIFR